MTNLKILKELTQTTFDSAEGFRTAVEKAESPALRSALRQLMTKRQATFAKLNSALTNSGEQPIASTSIASKAHQLFAGIADTFEDGNEAAVERIEEGEDYLVKTFCEALDKDVSMSDPNRSTIEAAYKDIREGERITDMLEKQYS